MGPKAPFKLLLNQVTRAAQLPLRDKLTKGVILKNGAEGPIQIATKPIDSSSPAPTTSSQKDLY